MVIVMDGADKGRSMWCILRTASSRTLPLANSLGLDGLEVWTPRRTMKRAVPGSRPDVQGRRRMMEIDAPILPSFVFARAAHLRELATIAADPSARHPSFSVFRHAGRAPLVADRDIVGLQDEERAALELINHLRDIEDREERRRLRAALMRTERERRKAMRSERRELIAGQLVTVGQMPAMSGMTGVVQSSDGRSAIVVFGGSLSMKIEAWQLIPGHVYAEPVPQREPAAKAA